MSSDRADQRSPVRMDELVSLCARRGFIFPSGELYGGINGYASVVDNATGDPTTIPLVIQ